MSTPSLIIEVRPRLQVCHVFVKKVRVEAVDLDRGHLKVVYNGDRSSFKVIIPGVELKPNSLSNFTLLAHSTGPIDSADGTQSITPTKQHSNATIDSFDGTYFRIQTTRCSLTPVQSSLFDYSARDTSYVPGVELGIEQALYCRCCQARLTLTGMCFRRVLPLPSDSWDMSDMFCHVHEGDAPSPGVSSHLHPKPGDLLYGAYNFILSSTSILSTSHTDKPGKSTSTSPTNTSSLSNNPTNKHTHNTNQDSVSTSGITSKNLSANAKDNVFIPTNEHSNNLNSNSNSTNHVPKETTSKSQQKREQSSSSIKQERPPLTNVQWGSRVVFCDQCASWLGTRQGESQVTLWNSTVQFRPVRSESTDRDGSERAGESGKNWSPTHEKEAEEKQDYLKKGPLEIDKIGKSETHVKKRSSDGQNDEKFTENSHKISAIHHPQQPPLVEAAATATTSTVTHPCFSNQDKVALSDFIAVVKENLGINSKLLIQCQVSDSSQHSLLLWIMDRNLTLVTGEVPQNFQSSPQIRVENFPQTKKDVFEADRNDSVHKHESAKGLKQDRVSSNESALLDEKTTKSELNKNADSTENGGSNSITGDLKGTPNKAQKGAENVISKNLGKNDSAENSGKSSQNGTNRNVGSREQVDKNGTQVDQLVSVKVSTVMKVLYTYSKDKPDPNWSKDFGLPQVSVSKVMFLNALRHLRMQGQNIPAPYRLISEMHVSYIVVG